MKHIYILGRPELVANLKNQLRDFFLIFVCVIYVILKVFWLYLCEKNIPHRDCSEMWAISKFVFDIAFLYEIYRGEKKKRLMGHIAHLRKHFKSINTYLRGGGVPFIVFAFLHLKDNCYFDHFIYWQLILQFSFPPFPLDNMHSVQWISNMWSHEIIAAIIVFFRY